jgi:DNA-binding transcriptional LysR family regulator
MLATPNDPTLLLALVAIAEEGSFSRAAVRMGVTKGTVSRKIARLEERAGVSLVWRTTHAVQLTGGGRELYERARGPVRALGEIAYELPQANAPLAGSIRIAAPQDVGSVLLPRVIERFNELNPRVTFDVHIGSEPINLVLAGIDLALRVSVRQMPRSSLVARKLRELALGFFAAPAYLARHGHPRSFGAPEHSWLTYAPRAETASKAARREQATLGAPPDLAPHRSDDFVLLRELALRGLGVVGLPVFVAEPLVRAGELTAVLTRTAVPAKATLYLVSPSQRKVSSRVAAFRTHVIEMLTVRR